MAEIESQPVPSMYEALNTVKLLLLLERAPCTDEFDLLMLSPLQYIQITNLIKSFMSSCHMDTSHVHCTVDRNYRAKLENFPAYFSDDEVIAAAGKLKH